MSENTPNIKLRTKESERPVVKIKNLPIDKRTENFAIKDDNSSVSDSSVISYKKMKPKKKKKLKEVDVFTKKKKSGNVSIENRFDMYSNPKRKIKQKIVDESEDDDEADSDSCIGSMTSSISGSDDGSSVSGSYSGSDDGSSIVTSASSMNKPKMSWKEIQTKKQDYLLKLHELENKGFKLTNTFTMKSDLEDMVLEYERHKKMAEREATVKFARKGLMFCVTGLEYMNGRFDPFNVKLKGWSESVMEDIGSYDTIFTKLAEKYSGKAEMAPELELMLSLFGSAFMFHLTQSMFGSALPGMGDVLKQNPELMSNIAKAMSQSAQPQGPPVSNNEPSQATMNGPGLDIGSLMGSLMGGLGNMSQPSRPVAPDLKIPPPSMGQSVASKPSIPYSAMSVPTPLDRPSAARTNDSSVYNNDNDRFSVASSGSEYTDNESMNITIPSKKKRGGRPKVSKRTINI